MSRVLDWTSEAARTAARPAVAEHLGEGGIVVYPTETVYGVGCVLERSVLETLAAFKGDRPFLVLIRGPEAVPALEWTDDARRLADAFWPGPLTLALTAEADRYPAQVVGPDGAVAVRVSPHAGIPDLLVHGPITSTSANRPGGPAARDAEAATDVAEAVEAAGGDALVLDGGRLPETAPSTIVRCGAENRLIREGAVPRSELERVVELV